MRQGVSDRQGESARSVVLNLVRARPGTHKSGIARSAGVAWGTADYHLDRLERDGHVLPVRSRGRVHFFPATREDTDPHGLLCSHDDSLKRGLLALHGAGVSGPSRLGRDLGITRRQATAVLRRLEELGLASHDGHYHPRFFLTPRGEEILADRRRAATAGSLPAGASRDTQQPPGLEAAP